MRCPRGARPYNLVMSVVTPLSSTNTNRSGSMPAVSVRHCSRRRTPSALSCSLACRLFFNPKSHLQNHGREPLLTDGYAFLSLQPSPQLVNCGVRLLADLHAKALADLGCQAAGKAAGSSGRSRGTAGLPLGFPDSLGPSPAYLKSRRQFLQASIPVLIGGNKL